MKLYHLDWEKSRELDEENHFAMTFGHEDSEAADARYLAVFEKGELYAHVADYDGDDFEHLYAATNNGVLSPSWSQNPPRDISVVGEVRIVGKNGKAYGQRSTSIGDLVEADGRLHVVATFGFREIGPVPEKASAPKP